MPEDAPQLVELTSKRVKRLRIIGAAISLCALVALFAFVAGGCRSPWVHVPLILLAVSGLAVSVYANFIGWWRHG